MFPEALYAYCTYQRGEISEHLFFNQTFYRRVVMKFNALTYATAAEKRGQVPPAKTLGRRSLVRTQLIYTASSETINVNCTGEGIDCR